MKNLRQENKSNTGEEKCNKHIPMTASHRREKAKKHIEEKQCKRAERKIEAKKCLLRMSNEDKDDISEDEANDDKGEPVVEESCSGEIKGDEEEVNDDDNDENKDGDDHSGDDDSGGDDSGGDDSGEGGGNEKDRDDEKCEEGSKESGEEDIQEVGDEDDFSGFEDDKSDYSLYEKGNDHVAYHLRNNIDRGQLTCKQYTQKLWTWELEEESKDTQRIIKGSVLYRLYDGSYRSVNKVLVSAFVERWHPETNTFHMPFGEVTITLDDVEELLEIPVTGKALSKIDLSAVGPVHVWVSRLLGIPAKRVFAELSRCKGNAVRTSWIIEELSSDGSCNHKRQPEQIARGFMLVLLGCTLFQDRSGDKVMVKYLYYLQDIENWDNWAWGAGALAFLYRMLSKASIFETTGVAGYLTLLEAWIYERFPKLRPEDPIKIDNEQIRTQKWNPSFQMSERAVKQHLKYVRGMLDNMKTKHFVWIPYRALDEDPSEVVWFYGCLVLDGIVEPYHPNRVVRQFGRVQNKPKSRIHANYANRKKIKGYRAKFEDRDNDFDDYSSHLLSENARGPRAKESGQCTVEYEEWYKSTAIIQLNHEVPSSVFTSDEYGEGHFTKKAIDVAEGYIKKGLKTTKHELLNALKVVVDILKEGGCVGISEVENGEASSSGKKTSKFVVETKGSKATEKTETGKRKTKDVMESEKKKPKTVKEPGRNKAEYGVRVREPSSIRKENGKDDTKRKAIVVEKEHRK